MINLKQWRTQDFRMGGVKVPQAPKGVGHGDGISPSTLGERPEFFLYFFKNTIS